VDGWELRSAVITVPFLLAWAVEHYLGRKAGAVALLLFGLLLLIDGTFGLVVGGTGIAGAVMVGAAVAQWLRARAEHTPGSSATPRT
jgi:hypothetical protein